MRAKAAESLCTVCLSMGRKREATRTIGALLRCLQTGRAQEKSSLRKTKGVCGNADCVARGQRALVRDAAMQTVKMSNKRKELLTATLRAHCGRAGGRGEKRETEKPAETFCFNGLV